MKPIPQMTKISEVSVSAMSSPPIAGKIIRDPCQRIEFNAHRVFSLSYLITLLEKDYDIVDFSFVDDKGDLNTSVQLNQKDIIKNYGCHYGCGIFELIKK